MNDDDDDGQGVSMSHVLNSVRELIEKLAKSEEAKKKEEEVRREELAFKADAVAKKLNSQMKKEVSVLALFLNVRFRMRKAVN